MQFPTTLLALLAGASLATAAAIPCSWSVTVTKTSSASGRQSQDVTAVYTSSSYPKGIKSTCHWQRVPGAKPAETSSCDNPAFSYTYDGTTISLQQTIDLPQKETVYGQAPLTLKSDTVGRTFTGSATVKVSKATA